MKTPRLSAALLAIAAGAVLSACGADGPDGDAALEETSAIAPAALETTPGASVQFALEDPDGASPAWSVLEPGGGTIDADGLYTAPDGEGTFHVLATRPGREDVAEVRVAAAAAAAETAALTAGPQLYVATTGNDANPGTLSQPWRTIQKAMRSAPPGATVNVKAGTYRERLSVQVSGTSSAWITFQPYGFSGAPGCGGWSGIRCGGDQVVIELSGFGTVTDGVPFLAVNGRSYVRIQGFTFQNWTVRGPMQRGVRISGASSFVEVSHNRFLNLRNTGPWDGRHALLTFWIEGAAKDVTIRGNELGNVVSSYGEAMTLAATRVTVERNWIHDTDGIGINVGHQSGLGPGSYLTVRANRLEWISKKRDGSFWYGRKSNAIYVNGGSFSVIERNLVRDAGWAYSVCSEPTFPASHHVTIRSNVALRAYAGVMVGNWYSSTNGSKVYEVKVLNNTIASSHAGFVIRPYQSATVQWKNNILSAVSSPVVNGLRWPVGKIDYNLYSGTPAGPDAHRVVADARFVSASTGDFRLQSTSPAIGAGDPYTDATAAGPTDHAGARRIVNRIEAGAHEVQ